MSSLHLENLPLPVARAIRAGKRLRITEDGRTVAIVEPQTEVAALKHGGKRLTARQWIATVSDKLSARPDLDAAAIVREGRDSE